MKNGFTVEKLFGLICCFCCTLLFTSVTTAALETKLDWALAQDEHLTPAARLEVLTDALREAYNRELKYYTEQESHIMKQISALESQKRTIQARKRSHVQCLVNVIACYRKRK